MRYRIPQPMHGYRGKTSSFGEYFRKGKRSSKSMKERARRRHKVVMELRKDLPPNFNFTVLFDMSTPELLQLARQVRRSRKTRVRSTR